MLEIDKKLQEITVFSPEMLEKAGKCQKWKVTPYFLVLPVNDVIFSRIIEKYTILDNQLKLKICWWNINKSFYIFSKYPNILSSSNIDTGYYMIFISKTNLRYDHLGSKKSASSKDMWTNSRSNIANSTTDSWQNISTDLIFNISAKSK